MYTEPVVFTETNKYENEEEDDIYTVEEFIECCKIHAFIDYDGFGYPVKNKLADRSIEIIPSQLQRIPKDATHIVWYNR